MRATVVYETGSPATREVAEAIADGLRARYETRCVSTREPEPEEFSPDDLVLIGGPTRWRTLRRVDGGLHDWLGLHRLDGCEVHCFATRSSHPRAVTGTALHALRRLVRRAGGDLVGRGRTFTVGASAREVLRALREARAWGAAVDDLDG